MKKIIKFFWFIRFFLGNGNFEKQDKSYKKLHLAKKKRIQKKMHQINSLIEFKLIPIDCEWIQIQKK